MSALLLLTGAALVSLFATVVWSKKRREIEHKLIYEGRNNISKSIPSIYTARKLNGQTQPGYYTVEPPVGVKLRGMCMFLHGNGGDAPHFSSFAKELSSNGWFVCMAEYEGYGARHSRPISYSANHRHLVRVWNEVLVRWPRFQNMPRLLMGFSLGGGFAHSIIDDLEESHAPTKLVLINTFAALSDVTSCVSLGSPEHANWSVDSQIEWKNGDVLVVYSEKDELFGPAHINHFKRHFGKRATFYRLHTNQTNINFHSATPLLDKGWLFYL